MSKCANKQQNMKYLGFNRNFEIKVKQNSYLCLEDCASDLKSAEVLACDEIVLLLLLLPILRTFSLIFLSSASCALCTASKAILNFETGKVYMNFIYMTNDKPFH